MNDLSNSDPGQEESESRPFICPYCERPALAYSRGKAIWSGWDFKTKAPSNPPVEYVLEQCSNCGDASLRACEDYGGGFQPGEYFTVYPQPRRLNHQVPSSLRNEYDEARRCFAAKSYTAAVVMVRRVLEGACVENGVHQRTLAKGLEQLRAKGLIDDTLSEWANALRIVGNKGAHYTGAPMPKQDAEDALAFTEALLDQIYVLRKRFEEFKRRQK